jgi:hypothetical protein
MLTLGCTRFSDETWLQNRRYCAAHNVRGCLYGTPRRIKETCQKDSLLLVLEMNNTRNRVMGIGLIKNTVIADKYYGVYDDGNYNRFVYKGKYRLDRDDLTEAEQLMLGVFDTLLFKGRRHCKLAQGITEVGLWIRKGPFDFIKYFRELFDKYHHGIEW